MKISVNALRVLLILLNLGLTAGFAAHFGYSHLAEGAIDVDIRDSSAMRLDGPVKPRQNREPDMAAAANWLNPRIVKPVPPVVKPPEPPDPGPGTEEEIPEEGELPEGPLGESWQFVSAFIFEEDPAKSLIYLERKKEEPKASSSSSRLNSRVRRIRSARSSSRSKARNPDDVIKLRLGQRYFKNEDMDLEFFLHAVSEKRFVYWTDTPGKMYSLPRKAPGPYQPLESPTLKPREEPESEEEEEKPEPKIRVMPSDYADRREKEYEELVAGKLTRESLSTLKPSGGLPSVGDSKRPPIRSRSSTSRSSSRSSSSIRRPSSSSKSSTVNRSSAKTPAKPMSPADKAKAVKELGGTIKAIEKSKNLSDKQRKDLQKLKETLGGRRSR